MKRKNSTSEGSSHMQGNVENANPNKLKIWENSNAMTFTPLGSGREVGRSCHVLEFKGKKIMLDIGIHPGRTGMNMLPLLDQTDLSDIDLLLVSHHHLDHSASLPYLTKNGLFRGQILMTGSTKAILRLVLMDYARILANDPNNEPLYTQKDVIECLDRCQTIGFHQSIEIQGISLQAYHAGHVLGAAMFLIEIAGVKILYTGDYSREDDRHLRGAEIPSVRPDVLIVEATFGVMVHEKREQREKRFTEAVEKVVRRGGNCLIPMGALGAVQELLLILEEHWNKNPDLKSINIYHTSSIANEALSIYRTYIMEMNDGIRSHRLSDPWNFENIGSLQEGEAIVGPAVVLASPGYLQTGRSRRLFELWCQDRKNGVILAGYAVEGTLAKDLQKEEVKSATSLNGTILQVECEVKTITFAAHSDYMGTKSFVEALRPKNVIFVHGEKEQMRKLRDQLRKDTSQIGMETEFFNPENCVPVRLQFQEQRIVKAYGGEMVQRLMRTNGNRVAAYLVRKDLTDRLVATQDVRLYTQLKTAVVQQKLHVPFHPKFEVLEECVRKLFVPVIPRPSTLLVHDQVELELKSNVVCISWDASPSNDMIADALTAILMQAEGGVPAVRVGTCCSAHAHRSMPEPKVEIVEEHEKETAEVEAEQEKEKKEKEIKQPEELPEKEEKQTATQQQRVATVEAGAELKQTLSNSQTASLVLSLLLERYGDEKVSQHEDNIRIELVPDVYVEVRFNEEGHVKTITPVNKKEQEQEQVQEKDAEAEAEEQDIDEEKEEEKIVNTALLQILENEIRQLVEIATLTLHPIM